MGLEDRVSADLVSEVRVLEDPGGVLAPGDRGDRGQEGLGVLGSEARGDPVAASSDPEASLAGALTAYAAWYLPGEH